jgi:UPF0755 protein
MHRTTKIFFIIAAVLLVIAIGGAAGLYYFFLAAPGSTEVQNDFIISQGASFPSIVAKLESEGRIKNARGFQLARRIYPQAIVAGGYRLSGSMNAFAVARQLTQAPDMIWMTFPEGLRKEEVAERIAKAVGWDAVNVQEFVDAARVLGAIAEEGVYFPDTYLMPHDGTGADIAKRMINRFNEKFAPLAPKFLAENIKYDTALRIASIVEREAAGEEDKRLIAGIIWNRLLQDMKLDIDATVQYARGNVGAGWWAPISSADKEIDSPFNTYKYRGLPPQPIDNPGLSSIRAVAEPEKTACIFYLHDADRVIHCARTYDEHKKNIQKYLR